MFLMSGNLTKWFEFVNYNASIWRMFLALKNRTIQCSVFKWSSSGIRIATVSPLRFITQSLLSILKVNQKCGYLHSLASYGFDKASPDFWRGARNWLAPGDSELVSELGWTGRRLDMHVTDNWLVWVVMSRKNATGRNEKRINGRQNY